MSFKPTRNTSKDLGMVVLTRDLGAGVSDGATVAGSWTTRALTAKPIDTQSIATLAANQFTLPAGKYLVRAYEIIFSDVGNDMRFKVRIRNITDSTTAVVGVNIRCHFPGGSSGNLVAWLEGAFEITGSKTFELQYYCTSVDSLGLGGTNTSTGESERYAEVVLEKTT